MVEMNIVVFAVILTMKTLKCFGSPTDLLLSSNIYSERVSSTTSAFYQTDQGDGTQEKQVFNEVEDVELDLIQTELPQVEREDSSDKPQQSLPTDSKLLEAHGMQNDEPVSSDDGVSVPDKPCDTCTKLNASGIANTSKTINDSRTKSSNSNTGNIADEEVQQRVEMFKRQILKKLNLKTPPNITHPNQHFPEQVLGQSHHGNRHHHVFQENKESSTKVYLLADEEDQECDDSKKSDCFRFQIKPVPEKQKLAAAQLWVYLGPIVNSTSNKRTLMVNLPSVHYGERHTLATKNVDVHEGWVEIPLGQHIKRFKTTDITSQLYISVTCKPNLGSESYIVTKETLRPILSLTYVVKNRERRQSNGQSACNTTSECCRKSLEVNFAQIGWRFVLTPSSYNLYYCKGTCLSVTGATGDYPTDHSQVVTLRLLTNPTVNSLTANEKREIAKNSVCCVPQSFGSLVILYQLDNGTIVRETIYDMVVNECGCQDALL